MGERSDCQARKGKDAVGCWERGRMERDITARMTVECSRMLEKGRM